VTSRATEWVDRDQRFPVSVKGVVLDQNGSVVLVKNTRDEWELPGGKLELGETPEQCVAREILEEIDWKVEPQAILDSWIYTMFEGRHVLIVTYGCRVMVSTDQLVSPEGRELAVFPLSDVPALNMPDGYKQSIQTWSELHA
jgi:8-oxo-dGTP pyrophosphatase MutT (NUDIX family)